MADFTPYQQKIIKRYYANLDRIQVQKLAELVSELFLAEGKKRQRLWKSAANAMKKVGVPDSTIDWLQTKDDPALLAKIVQELLAGS